MPLSIEQVQVQTQRLVMTPQMQLSIRLLQMNTLEIEQLAQQEILENPFLEMEEEPVEEPAEREEKERDDRAEDEPADVEYEEPVEPAQPAALVQEKPSSTAETIETPEPAAIDSNDGAETFDQVDVAWDEYYDDSGPYTRAAREAPEEERDFTEYTPSRSSLYDHLLWQLRVSPLEGKDLEIGEYLVGNIDSDGRLTMPVEEVAEALGVELERVENALRVIHTFDPTGIGARDLSECLLLQLESKGFKAPIYKRILTEFLTQLGQQKFKEIAKALGVDESRIMEALRHIRHCEPYPGRSITKDSPRYVEPDIYVKKIDGRYLYFLNEGDLRHLRINDYYKSVLRGEGLDSKEKDYYRDKYRSAVWLIRNIERRKGTILRVTEAIMEFQKDFMDKGPEHVRPLTLKQIAETVGMHEATIARVTANKYVETPRGVFLLKYFFSSSLEKNDGGDAASSRSVKEIIRKMIAAEIADSPLSDSEITKILMQKGVNIARRTVAKYRDQLKILPANLRKGSKQ